MTRLEDDLDRLHELTSRFARLYQLRPPEERLVYGLSVSEVYALASLGDGALPMSTLAAELRLSKGRVTRLVDRLEREGLAARKRDHDDARVQRVVLTRAGRGMLGRVQRRFRAQIEGVLAPLSARATADFLRGLERLVGAIEHWRSGMGSREVDG